MGTSLIENREAVVAAGGERREPGGAGAIPTSTEPPRRGTARSRGSRPGNGAASRRWAMCARGGAPGRALRSAARGVPEQQVRARRFTKLHDPAEGPKHASDQGDQSRLDLAPRPASTSAWEISPSRRADGHIGDGRDARGRASSHGERRSLRGLSTCPTASAPARCRKRISAIVSYVGPRPWRRRPPAAAKPAAGNLPGLLAQPRVVAAEQVQEAHP